MNREILFRGKRIDNGEWIYGFYVPVGERNHYILTGKINIIGVAVGFEHVAVAPEIVSQYTGLTDKNGVKIFEGDIVKGTAYSFEFIGVIEWIDGIAGFGVRYKSREDATAWENSSILKCASRGRTDEFTAEVIGNIHDNPELLEGD